MSNIVKDNRTGREKFYGLLMVIFGAALWPLLTLSLVGALASADPSLAAILGVYIFYGVLIALFIWIAGIAYRATAFGNMILLGPQQFPHLHAMVEAGAKELGMSRTPKTFLFNGNGLVNAFARRILGGPYVFLTSALVEVDSDEQVKFVIGHELGHHAAGHLNGWMNFLKLPAYVVPFLQSAYSRQREYTCDGIGVTLSKDLAVSRTSLMMLGCGCGRLNSAMNCEAFMAQEAMVPPVFGFLTEIFRSHPRLTRRVGALKIKGVTVGS